MSFVSLSFLILFAAVLAGCRLLSQRGQNVLLLAASYVFYGWVHPWFCALLAASTVTDYAVALAMRRFPDRRRLLLAASLAANLGMLCWFKYFNFFAETVRAALGELGVAAPALATDVMLPVGISFYTFQTLSYVVDVYRGDLEPRRDLLDFALFVSFFPQLVAGPIERAGHLLPQVERPRSIRFGDIESGLELAVWGFFKKMVIADNLGPYADRIFELREPGWAMLAAGAAAFSVQIFADFSGYCDIARGAARMMGFELMDNFDAPYAASSPSDFWRRWHISLSSWFRDYVYIPLGGSRSGTLRFAAAAGGSMVLSGLWHGASANFVVWGAYHGVLLVGHRLLAAPLADRLTAMAGATPVRLAGIVFMWPVTLLGWILFRQHDTPTLMRYFATDPFASTPAQVSTALGVAALAVVLSVPMLLRPWVTGHFLARQIWLWLALIGIAVLAPEHGGDFIYFAF